ncbi:MAG: RNA-directed DNA polymerase [Alphaproteobacteria bacterium]|nr:RNA-directed DNA polymerase [Alphaproteobacteria bacterium]MBU0804394.1 RNA-directed DNA polymerase [Alphaproteobacteria bacterium]MBU0871225.1 RNA-directed DNA polymerase [Alphaproteobacteria bacterium]MBU1400980.1 RNA-directed DNA polymerase [Alphaproteobacteria bacterium]MBU1592603.1 RNA-directed DNA polymerase [Alphaproteobacteria bacterium]
MPFLLDRPSLLRTIQDDDIDLVGGRSVASLREELADQALDTVKNGFVTLNLQTLKVQKKTAYRNLSKSHSVVLRRLNYVLRNVCQIYPSDRDTVVRRLITVLQEGVPHRLYKFDIASFYESIDTTLVAEAMSVDRRIPRQSFLLIQDYLRHLRDREIAGLPRGLSISATLSEYALQAFDHFLAKNAHIYYYARYVDDIVIVTGGHEDFGTFQRSIESALGSLSFNPKKTQLLELPVDRKANGETVVGFVDYLGYRFSVHTTKKVKDRIQRNISVGIAASKISRLKSRIACSFCQYFIDHDSEMLKRRIQLLSGNYNIRDYSTSQLRNVGLFCNYRRINTINSLDEIDRFFRSIVAGERSRLSRRFRAVAPTSLRNSLMMFSFKSSFSAKVFYNFPHNERVRLSRCWQNV